MRIHCPSCGQLLPATAMNVAADVAVCPGCNEAFKLSELIAAGQDADLELGEPPPGTWFRTTFDGWELGASTRCLPLLLFLVPFTLVWSGGSLGGIYGTQIFNGEFNILQSLFGIPFALGTVALVTVCLLAIAGKVTITVRGDDGEVFTGIGFIGRRKRFRWDEIQRVEEESRRDEGTTHKAIVLAGKSLVKFGSGLGDARRFFMLQVLRKMLAGTRKVTAFVVPPLGGIPPHSA